MALEDLFVREIDGEFNFVANRENGLWVLTKEKDLTKLSDLIEDRCLPPRKHNDTSMILLNTGKSCNLDCVYCHVGSEKTSEKMFDEVGKSAIDRVAELGEDDQFIIFHGNEPLINYDLIRKLVYHGQSKGITRFGVQTNGTLLDDEKLDFFAKNNVGVGISIDGLKRHHDTTRPFTNGNSSYDLVVKNIDKTIRILGGVSVITVVSNHNVKDLEEISDDFEKRGISSVRFSPVYPNCKNSNYVPNLDIFISQMKKVCDFYLDGLVAKRKQIKISNFQEFMRTVFSPKETTNCAKCSGGHRQPLMAIDVDGAIYPCDFFWGRKEYCVGNIMSDSIRDGIESEKNFRNYRNFDSQDDCVFCDWKTFCGSGCPGSSVMAGKGILSKDSYCEYTKSMLDYVVSKIPELYGRKMVNRVLDD